jgi:hypothetical protein
MLAGTAPGGKLIGIGNKCPVEPRKRVGAAKTRAGARRACPSHRMCKSCNHRAEPDVATQVAQHGAGMTVIDWASLLRCTECGKRDADFVASGARR